MAAGTLTADGRARVLADGNEIPLLGLGVWQVPDGPRVRGGGALGAGGRLPPHRHRAGLRQRAQRRHARCATAACRATRSSSRRSSIPGARTPRPRRSAASSGSASTTSTSTSSTGRRAGRRGRGTGMQRAQAAGYARSIGVSNFSVAELDELLGDRRRRPPVVNQVQFSPFEFRRGAAARRARRAASRSRPTARSAPAATSATRASREIAERLGRTPAQVLIRWCAAARPDRAAEVDAPRAHRGERAGLRLRALRRGHGRARRARRDRRDGPRRAREPVVVTVRRLAVSRRS